MFAMEMKRVRRALALPERHFPVMMVKPARRTLAIRRPDVIIRRALSLHCVNTTLIATMGTLAMAQKLAGQIRNAFRELRSIVTTGIAARKIRAVQQPDANMPLYRNARVGEVEACILSIPVATKGMRIKIRMNWLTLRQTEMDQRRLREIETGDD